MRERVRRFRHLVRWQLMEIAHQRVPWLLSGVALAMALSGGVLRLFHFGADEARFHAGVALAGLWTTGTLLAALLAPMLIGPRGESRLAQCLFARGVGRGEWIGAVFASLAAVQGWLLLLTGAALATTLGRHGHAPALAELSGQAGGLLVLNAAAVLFAAIFQRTIPATTATLGFGLAMQLEPLFGRMAASSRGAEAFFWQGLDLLVPGGAITTLGAVGYLLVYLGMATVIHAQREI
ncbi:MAG: hypothetical protein C0502_07970 [Opitutus sp.]|nr:hypothetical protein [Opitutus sp.]